ncbi:MAG: hypothetical protein ACFFCI_07845 [Promethearchaeota archaeon]
MENLLHSSFKPKDPYPRTLAPRSEASYHNIRDYSSNYNVGERRQGLFMLNPSSLSRDLHERNDYSLNYIILEYESVWTLGVPC